MRLILKISIFLIFALNISNANEPIRIAFSFDDAPMSDSYLFTGDERTKIIIDMLDKFDIKAVFYCNSKKFDEYNGLQRIQDYNDAGHYIANHSHSHYHPHKVGAETYIEDIKLCHENIKDFSNFKQWYRYPFLNQGTTESMRDSIWNTLDEMNYLIGYTTVDNYEWYVNKQILDALKTEKISIDECREYYLEHVLNSIEFYHNIALNELDINPAHVLLLHENDVSTYFLEDLITEMQKRGMEIIDPAKAYEDEIASNRPNTMVNYQGRIISIAVANGYQDRIWQKTEDTKYLDSLFQENIFPK
jgi:peptidoglycan/xylan/chitin deacetylase (PgdA/CDA1 family)